MYSPPLFIDTSDKLSIHILDINFVPYYVGKYMLPLYYNSASYRLFQIAFKTCGGPKSIPVLHHSADDIFCLFWIYNTA